MYVIPVLPQYVRSPTFASVGLLYFCDASRLLTRLLTDGTDLDGVPGRVTLAQGA